MKILIDLNDIGSIDRAIRLTGDYLARLETFRRMLVDELARTGAEIAQVWFADAVYAGDNDVVTGFRITNHGRRGVVYARGTAVMFIEFGTGIRKADNFEERAELTGGNVGEHGTYGLRQGENWYGWIYKGKKGKRHPSDTTDAMRFYEDGRTETRPGYVHTYGNDANSSLWLSRQELEDKYSEIVREVWERTAK